ncbi:GTP 3',8-cyclase MoaA [Granulosicoccaceae sp. 1_MG-2023]|nr:GTP 3',8-cyclase MoaA [Granulosicoccaceae sp. 1_MG-2023]
MSKEEYKLNTSSTALQDRLGRQLHDLRISVTDRCNFRCVYCMPKEKFGRDHRFLPRDELLHFEEIERVARLFAGLGVRKIRLTGGEPLVRAELETLIRKLRAIDGITDLSLTSNASLMTEARARSLRDAGLNRVNISLDALDEATFHRISDVNVSVDQVLQGIEHAASAGFDSVKVNMVVKKGLNDHCVLPMARHFHGSGKILRFIEFMDVGNTNGWQSGQVVAAQQIVDTISRELPLEPVGANYPGEVAKRWKYKDGGGEIGVISSVTQPFCGSCSRIRLSAVGKLYTCLFASEGTDIREALRSGDDDAALLRRLRALWSQRQDRYSETRTQVQVLQPRSKIEMSYIGG